MADMEGTVRIVARLECWQADDELLTGDESLKERKKMEAKQKARKEKEKKEVEKNWKRKMERREGKRENYNYHVRKIIKKSQKKADENTRTAFIMIEGHFTWQ